MEQSIYLILENGTVFSGKAFGAVGEATGEVVFTTSMTGYLETLTDPVYCGQIVLQTFPLIGNYGVIPSDFESAAPKLSAYIVREWCHDPSNFRCEGDLDAFLKASNTVGMYGIDTRRLTKIIRESGVMNAKIVTELPEDLAPVVAELAAYHVENAVAKVSCEKAEVYPAENAVRRVVLWDFGTTKSVIDTLCSCGCEVVRMPASSTAEEILAENPDGVMLSDGPGDPAENTEIIKEIAKLCESRVPVFGAGLGHQLLALSQGAKTEKMHHGHRGANHPVKDLESGRVYATAQSHGYSVLPETLPSSAKASFLNVNDHTNEGISYLNIPAFSVQFQLKSCGGPLDIRALLGKFVELIDKNR